MDNPTGLFKFSRAGKVIHEGIPYDQAVRLITDGAILPSDFYWVSGMTDWQLVSSRVWVPSSSPKSPPPPLPQVDEDLNEQDALKSLQGILTVGEKVLYYAIQRRLFAIFSRRVLIAATNGRVIVITRGLFGGFTMQDYRWQDIADSKISTGVFGADLVLVVIGGRTCLVNGLRKEQASALYRHAQAEEQSWREKLRVRQIEEMRARSGGVHIGSTSAAASAGTPVSSRLAQAKQMLTDGLISDSEYEAIKAKIVSEI